MIIGIGTDICAISRIDTTLKQFGSRFKQRIYSPYEIEYADSTLVKRAKRYAQFFAAKEACAKALGTGFTPPIYWRDITVTHTAQGQPLLHMQYGAYEHALTLCNGKKLHTHISLSDEQDIAQAVVILEAV